MKKVKKMMKKIIVTIVFVFSTTGLTYAKNLGVWGPLFPIEEQDIREFIYQRINKMKQNGEIEKLNARFIKNAKEHILRPPPVKGLTTTDNPKTFYYDPTYVLDKNIEDDKGKIIAKVGTIINPLDTIKLHGVLFLLDADDKRQIKWALENVKKYVYVKHILIRGNIKDAGNVLKDRIYFDQDGLITKKLGITHIPCIVKQEGKKLKIEEFSLKNEVNELRSKKSYKANMNKLGISKNKKKEKNK